MRFRTLLSISLVAFCLSACGGKNATSTVAPLPSASIPPLPAPSTPGATTTVVASASAQIVTVQTVSPPTVLVTPTPLATPSAVVGTRTPVGVNGVKPSVAPPTVTAAPQTAPVRTSPQSQTAGRMTDLPGVSPQQVLGTAQDGLVLLNVRVGKNDGFTRIVFDLAKQDGSAAPVPQTRLWREGDTVVIAFGGVREDVFGQSLGGGEQAINTGAVQSVYRIPVRDDSSAAYGIALHGGAKATLSSAASPTRVIVDIADK